MTAQGLRLAYPTWKATHEAVHGELPLQERLIAQEVLEFLMAYVQCEDVPVNALR